MKVELSIKYNLNESDWNAFAAQESADGGFLQSWGWGVFQQDSGRKINRLAVFDGEKLAAIALVVKQEMPLGFCYLYIPRGPIISASASRPQVLDFLFGAVKKIAQGEQAIFLRLDPPWQAADDLLPRKFSPIGMVQPKSTLILDLNLSDEELLAQMKPKTRYNIKLAQKHEIKIKTSSGSDAEFSDFWRLLKLTSKRDKIKSHGEDYYRKMLKCRGVKLVFAEYGGKPVAANIMAEFGGREIYLYGASDYDYRDKMAPYLLQWVMISEAKKIGCRFYDFWGADAKIWPGVTRFKQGFAPNTPLTQYAGAFDLVFNSFLYKLYNFVRRYVR